MDEQLDPCQDPLPVAPFNCVRSLLDSHLYGLLKGGVGLVQNRHTYTGTLSTVNIPAQWLSYKPGPCSCWSKVTVLTNVYSTATACGD